MNEEEQYIIETDEPSPKNNFPIVLQLGVLVLVLVGIFGTLFFSSGDGSELAKDVVVPVKIENTNQELEVQKIGKVEVVAEAAYVWDVKSQRALFAKNENEILPIASITKLMTTLLAHELVSDKELTSVPLSAIKQEGSSGLSVGEEFDIKTLQELSLISSSNDAAFALAASVGELLGDRDPARQFVSGMNIRAEELGLHTLNFKNPTGLDISPTEPGAVGTARDISFLMEYIVTEYPSIIEPTKMDHARVYNTEGEYHELKNTNIALKEIPNLLGSKTGFTDLAGGNLTIAFDLGYNRPIVVTVLHSTSEDRFTDVLKLVKAVQSTVISDSE